MKSKLVTFGCSFTDWQWPTWADWMGHYYDDHEKLAKGGTGNRAIFHTLISYLGSKSSFENEQIVIQWTSAIREDRYDKENNPTEYRPGGNVTNNPFYDKEYIEQHYSTLQNTVETVNYIFTAKKLLDSLNIEYVMTFMLDPRIGLFLGEPGYKLNNVRVEELKLIKAELKKLNLLIDDKFTDKCLTMHQLDEPRTVYSFYDIITGEIQKEGHPSPYQHYSFFKKYIQPKVISKSFTPNADILKCVQDWEEYAKIKKSFNEKEHLQPKSWPSNKRYLNGSEIQPNQQKLI